MPQPQIVPSIYIGTTELQCYAWETHGGSYGTLGTARLYTSIKMLRQSGLNIVNLSENAVTPVAVSVSVIDSSGLRNLIFAGGFDRFEPSFHDDRLVIHARDMAAPLYDDVIAISELQYQNVTPSQLASQLATQYGLTADVDPTPGGTTIGAIYNQQTSFSSRPRSPWALLESLAQSIGFILSVQPFATGVAPTTGGFFQGILQFKNPLTLPGSNTNFIWRAPTHSNTTAIPIHKLDMIHQPRKNKSFVVRVVSQDPNTNQPVVVTALGGHAVSSFSATSRGVPVYLFNVPGKTYAQALQFAQGQASDIAKRELIANVTIAGMNSLRPLDRVTIQEAIAGDLLELANKQLYVNSVTHHFGMAELGSADAKGYLTTFTALTIPVGITTQ